MSTPSEPVSVTITQEEATPVVITQESPPDFTFALIGPQGPKGDTGPTANVDALTARVDALETRVINVQTGTSYTLTGADKGAFVTMNNSAASTLTVPPNSAVAFPIGTYIEGAQLGVGQVTITPGSGVTVNSSPGLRIASQYGTFGLLKIGTDTWIAYGRLA